MLQFQCVHNSGVAKLQLFGLKVSWGYSQAVPQSCSNLKASPRLENLLSRWFSLMPQWQVRTGCQQVASFSHHGTPPQKCLSVSSWHGHQYWVLLSFLDTKPTTFQASIPSPPLISCNLVTTHWNISPSHEMANTLFPMLTLFPPLYG